MRQLGTRKPGEIGRPTVERVTWQVSGCGTRPRAGMNEGGTKRMYSQRSGGEDRMKKRRR